MEEFGIRAAKDYITVDEFHQRENQSENKIKAVRRPAQEFAKKILPIDCNFSRADLCV
jgi:hypothetical protein